MSCCGFENATGLTSEADFTIASNLLYNEILINCNLCFSNSSNYTSNSSNYLFNYSSNNSNNLFNNIGGTSNNFINFSNQIKGWINSNADSNYIYFHNSNNTIINSNSELFVYHNSNFLIPLDNSGYWSVEDKITSNIIETNLIKFDFSLLQSALTGISSLISTIQGEISALEASDVAQLAGLVALEQQIESINAILSSLDFSMNSLYPLEIVDKNIFINYNSNQFNLDGCNLNIQSIYSSNAPSNPHQTNGSISVINNQFAYFKWIRNGTITFPQNISIDFLVVGAGGNGGAGFYGGGGGAGEVIYKASHSISAGTYNIQVGNSLNRISRIYQGGTNIVSANGGGDGGFYDIVRNSIFNYYLFNNSIGVINYVNNVNLNEGTNKLIFNEGYIEVNGVKDKSYPLIKRTNITLNPHYWYKFISTSFLTNDGSVGVSGNLVNFNNITPDTINFIKTNASASFNGTNQYFQISYNNNLRTIQTTTGLSISFWMYAKPKTPQNYYIFSIDDGFDTGLRFSNFFEDISIQFEVSVGYETFIKTNPSVNYPNEKWYFITITFATNFDVKLYINNELVSSGNFQLPNINLTRFIIGGGINPFYFQGNLDDFRIYHSLLTTDEITELYKGSIIVNKQPTSGGSGGGGTGGIYFNTQTGASAGVPWNALYSKLNNGSNGVINGGGNGGSALINGNGYTEIITDNDLVVGKGGNGNSDTNYYPETKSNYGDGGDGYGGEGFQGVIIIKVPYIALEHTFTGFSYWSNVKNVSVSNPIELGANNLIGLKRDASLNLNGSGQLSVVKTATTPIIITGNDFSLSYDASLTKIGNNLSVVKTASNPINITGNNWSLNYDSTLTLNGNQLSVSGNSSSKWTQSGNNIYNNNSGYVGIGTIIPEQLLHIHTNFTNTRTQIKFTNGDTGIGNNGGFVGLGGDGNFYIDYLENGDIRFTTNNTERLRINNQGNLGVGDLITTPESLFEIKNKQLNFLPSAWFFTYKSMELDIMENYTFTNNNVSVNSDGLDIDRSANFNGTNARIYSATNYGINGVSFSICFWIKTSTSQQSRYLFELGNVYGGVGDRMFISLTTDNRMRLGLDLINPIDTDVFNDLDTWVHYTFVYTKDTYNIKIYRNGILNVETYISSNTTTNFSAFTSIGGSTIVGSYFAGRLYDFRIYRYALSAYEIGIIYRYKNSFGGLCLNSSGVYNDRLNICHYPISNNKFGYKFHLTNQTNKKDIIYIDDSGRVGIGKPPSNVLLDVNGAINCGTILYIRSPSYNTAASIDFATPVNSSSVAKVSIIAQGVSSFSRADLYFCLNNTADNTTPVSLTDSKMVIKRDGNVGINQTNPAYKLDVSGDINFTGNLNKNSSIYVPDNAIQAYRLRPYPNEWHVSNDGTKRFYFAYTDRTYFGAYNGYGFRDRYDVDLMTISNAGFMRLIGCISATQSGNYALDTGYMTYGSLTLGSLTSDYGWGSGWTSSTACIMLECYNNTEIAVHDVGDRVMSLIAYEHTSTSAKLHIGRDMGWGAAATVNFPGGRIALRNEWYIYVGTSSSGVNNSLIFNHATSTISSFWWFNGAQTNTQSEISDKRVKKNIKTIENSIDKLLLIEPKEYNLCSDKDFEKKYGIIAQDIYDKEELKHLIYKDEEYIANIFSKAIFIKTKIGENIPDIDLNDEKYIKNEKNKTPLPIPEPIEIFKYELKTDIIIKDLIHIDDELKIVLDNKDKNNLEIIIDDTPYNNRYKKRYVKVKAIIDDYTIEIYNDIDLTEIEKENLFIYGKKVDDFLKLDYQSLYCLHLKATQDLYKIIQKQQEQINYLINEINQIK